MRGIGNLNLFVLKPAQCINFKGLTRESTAEKSTYLLAFDLDGTFLECDKKSIEKFMDLSKQRNCKLAYVSGRVLSELDSIREKFAQKGIEIPVPDFFISNNGQYLYENINGKMFPSEEWNDILVNTGFDRDQIIAKMEKLVDQTSVNSKPSLMQFDYRKCDLNIEYLVGSNLVPNIKKVVGDFLKESNIKARVIYDYVPSEDIKATLPMFAPEIQERIKPLLDKNGGLLTFYLSAANKADSVEFLRTKLKLDKNHVITAGNAGNDISLATSGFWFVLVRNAQEILKEIINTLSSDIKEKIIQASKNGTAGINEALEQIFSRVGLIKTESC